MAGAAFDAQTLLALPLFAGLTPADIAGLGEHLTTEDQPRGGYLFRSGEPGDALYVVLAGQIALHIETPQHEELLSLCGPGDWFGELALLTDGPRSADARATVDATLLRISRAGWAEIGLRAPGVFARLCERLGHHLRVSNEPRHRARRTVIACGGHGDDDAAWILDLAERVRRQFPDRELHVLALDGRELIDGDGTAEARPEGREQQGDRAGLGRALARIVAPDALTLLMGGDVAGLADRRLTRHSPTMWTLEPGGRARPCDTVRGGSPAEALDRVARHIAGGTVGLALGAGGAYGFAHLGMQLAIEAAGIPVDYIAGTSMGAIIGCAWAAGVPNARTIALARKMAKRFRVLVIRDLNPRGPTLLRGAGVMQLLSEIEELRDAQLESLTLPFVAIAMDLGSGSEVLLQTGAALEGIRPSFAMPGIFPACTVDGRALIDGAMVNPVPVDTARALGADFVIAHNVIPPLSPVAEDPIGRLVGGARRFAERLPLWQLCSGFQNFEVYLRSFQALWFQLAGAALPRADAALQPDLKRFWYLQFGEARAIIEAGVECAEAQIPVIKTALRERIGLVC